MSTKASLLSSPFLLSDPDLRSWPRRRSSPLLLSDVITVPHFLLCIEITLIRKEYFCKMKISFRLVVVPKTYVKNSCERHWRHIYLMVRYTSVIDCRLSRSLINSLISPLLSSFSMRLQNWSTLRTASSPTRIIISPQFKPA